MSEVNVQEPVLQVMELKQAIGQQEILQGINLKLHAGECLGVFGVRAAGKSTLLNILAGIDRFSSGEVEILGCNIQKEQSFKKGIGLITQEKSLFQDLRAGDNLDFIATLKNASLNNMDSILKELDLLDYLREPVNMLEAGVYQRLAMACALLGEPRILIADELINDIDLYSRKLVLQVLQKFIRQGGACIWAFSNMELYHYMYRIAWLEEGLVTIYEPVKAWSKWNEQLQAINIDVGECHV